MVLTYLDEGTLKQIANITSARYFRATDTQSLTRIYTEIDQFEKTKFKNINTIDHKELAVYLLIPAALLLGIEILVEQHVPSEDSVDVNLLDIFNQFRTYAKQHTAYVYYLLLLGAQNGKYHCM